MSALVSLELGLDGLTGSIPPELGNLSALRDLRLGYNNLSGTIPVELGNLSNLQVLYLTENQLTGTIPAVIGNLSALQELRLSNNQLTGNIPPQLGNLINLQMLFLDDNQLTGSIPSALGNLTNLTIMHLNMNQLEGDVPAEFANLESLIDPGTDPYNDGLQLDYNYLNVSFGYPDLTNPFHVFLFQKDPDWHISQVSDFNGCESVTSIPQIECEALVALYNATDGENWTDNTNWLVINTPAYWYGVTVYSGHVTRIELWNNQLSGGIPTQLGDLASLQNLNLFANNLSGSIPAELGNLSALQYLSLDVNELTGSIPAELGNLSELRDLWLDNNQLTGSIPSELGNLSNLELLSLWDNQLTGAIPPELGNLTNLNLLLLARNRLTGEIPASLASLTNVREDYWGDGLDLDYNWLTVPADYPNPADPLHAFLSVNDPDWHQRQNSHFDGCDVVTEIPQSECEALIALYNSTDGENWTDNTNWLVSNTPSDWYGVIVESGHITEIVLRENELLGSIPVELGNLPALKYLDLYDNLLTGSIPTELANLFSLISLSLTSNRLTGDIPSELGNLASLEKLWLSSNKLNGNIPPELGNLSALQELGLAANQLTGNIPPELGTLSALKILTFSYNLLTGSIPPELGNLMSLEQLYLNHNQLGGEVPESLANLTNLSDWLTSYVGLRLEYNWLIVPADYPNVNNSLHVFLSQKDHVWHLHQTVEQTIGSTGGEVESLDGKTTLSIPDSTLPDESTVTFVPQEWPLHETGSLQLAQNSFQILATDSTGEPITTFSQPITLTIEYTDAEIAGLAEDSLRLYYWNEAEEEWQDVVTTCPDGHYTRQLAANILSAPLCHLSDFTLAGEAVPEDYHVYLPLVVR